MYEKMLDMQIGSSEQLITSNLLDQKEAQSLPWEERKFNNGRRRREFWD